MSEEKSTTFLSAADILATDDISIEDVWVPEWKTNIRLRALNAAEVVAFVRSLRDDPKTDDEKVSQAAKMVLLSAVTEENEPLFTADQLQALQKKSFSAILRLQKVAMRLNGMGDDELKAAKNA